MIYIALGDSITFGEDASSLTKAYPALTVSAIRSSSRRVTGYVLARPGWDSNDLLDAVIWKGSPAISHASVVSIWIGGVDLVNAALTSLKNKQSINATQHVHSFKRNLRALLAIIKKESHARIVCCTQYNPFPSSPLSVIAIDRLNQTTTEVAHHCGATVAPVHSWFEGKQAALIYGYRKGRIEDALSGKLPIHPNDRGHRVIASGLAPYLISPK